MNHFFWLLTLCFILIVYSPLIIPSFLNHFIFCIELGVMNCFVKRWIDMLRSFYNGNVRFQYFIHFLIFAKSTFGVVIMHQFIYKWTFLNNTIIDWYGFAFLMCTKFGQILEFPAFNYTQGVLNDFVFHKDFLVSLWILRSTWFPLVFVNGPMRINIIIIPMTPQFFLWIIFFLEYFLDVRLS